jgi:hypothetical protein
MKSAKDMSFQFVFTEVKLLQLSDAQEVTHVLFDACVEIFPHYELTTVNRVAAMIAQCLFMSPIIS